LNPFFKRSTMKTLYFIFIILSTCVIAQAQSPAYEGGNTPQSLQPPKVVAEKFKTEFPGIIPAWRIEDNYYVADFADTSSFKGRSIAYDKNAKIFRRESEVENSSYPSNINTYYMKNYPGEKFKTFKSWDEKGVPTYCIKRTSGSLWFDKEGNYINPEKKNEQTAAAD